MLHTISTRKGWSSSWHVPPLSKGPALTAQWLPRLSTPLFIAPNRLNQGPSQRQTRLIPCFFFLEHWNEDHTSAGHQHSKCALGERNKREVNLIRVLINDTMNELELRQTVQRRDSGAAGGPERTLAVARKLRCTPRQVWPACNTPQRAELRAARAWLGREENSAAAFARSALGLLCHWVLAPWSLREGALFSAL